MLEINIKFFKQSKIGYFSRKKEVGSINKFPTVFNELNNWARSIGDIQNTSTYERNPDDDLYGTYFCDYANSLNGDALLVLWNEIPNDDGTMLGLPLTATAGNVNILQTDFDKPAIPGMPSYFWIIPEIDCIAVIKFKNSTYGRDNFERYVFNYLSKFTAHQVCNDEGEITGFSVNGADSDGSDSRRAIFKMLPVKNQNVETTLLNRFDEIRRVIKKTVLRINVQDDRNMIVRFFDGLINNPPAYTENRQTIESYPVSFSREQVEEIINNFHNTILNQPNSPLSDISFQMTDNQILSLSGSILSVDHDLEINVRNNSIVSADEMLRAMSRYRQAIINENLANLIVGDNVAPAVEAELNEA